MAIYLRLIACLTLLKVFEVSCETGADVDSLLNHLFTTNSYNKKIRPLIDQTGVLTVNTDFYLNSVIEFDEQAEVLKVAGYLYFMWVDDYLKWTPSDYNNTEEIFLPQDDIWKPDVSLRNTYKSFTGLGSSYLNVRVYYDGTIDWYPFQILESTCAVDITYFPFDKQSCELKFTAWSYDKSKVDLDAGKNGVTLEDYTSNAQWELTRTYYKEVNSGEAAVIFVIVLSRKPSFYVINILVPVILLSVLNVFAFILPVASGEKASYAVTVFLSLAVFLTIIASELPKNSDHVSLMSVYMTLMSSLSTFIVVVCIFQLSLSTRDVSKTPINKFFLFLVKMSLLLRCKACPQNNTRPSSNDLEVVEEEKEDKYDWIQVVNAIDFLFFWLSLAFTVLCTAIIFGTSVNKN